MKNTMQIYVCVKHVPDTAANIKVNEQTGFDESVKFVVNPYDEYCVEEAVTLVERAGHGEVVVVAVGQESAIGSMRSALAMGAHRGILVKTTEQFTDSSVVARALGKAIEQDGDPDIIFTGKQSVDSEGMQTMYRLGAELDIPVVTDVSAFEFNGSKVIAKRDIGGGVREIMEISTPCIIGATKGLNDPRYPKFPDIMKAKKKQIKEIGIDLLGVDLTPKSEISLLEAVLERSGAKILEGSAVEVAAELVHILKNEEKVI